jgi:hypothetical protein
MLAALVYPNETYPHEAFQRVVEHCRSRGLKLAGVLQHSACDDQAHPCDVVLENLVTGSRVELFERRGKGARGCRLDLAVLTEVSVSIERALGDQPDLLILNKFGKAEAEGGGLGECIASAMEQGVPTLIGVPLRNLEAWRGFAGEMAAEFADDGDLMQRWLELSEHDPEKCEAVFRKDHAQSKR